MRTTIHSLLLGTVLGLGPLVLPGGCGSGAVTQVNPDAGPAGSDDAGVDTSDLAGRDLAGADLATRDLASSRDLAGSVNPEADPKLQGITALHNQARAAVNPQPATALPALTWDTTVAAAAQTWANNCMFMHSSNGYGENIYAASAGSNVKPSDVVNYWVAEKANYNYNANTCSSVCGHYTQVVWRASLRLGCAQKTCTTNSPFGSGSWEFWVCDYDPPGNFNGQRPY